MNVVARTPDVLSQRIEDATRLIGPCWPLDRAVAVNPLVDSLEVGFEHGVALVASRFGCSPWPSMTHLREAEQRGWLEPIETTDPLVQSRRLPTAAERVLGMDSSLARDVRLIIGHSLLGAVTSSGCERELMTSVADLLESTNNWAPRRRRVRRRAAQLIRESSLEELTSTWESWSDDAITEEFARQFARLPGWTAWAKWNDLWATHVHRARVTRREILTLSLAVELAALSSYSTSLVSQPEPGEASSDPCGRELLAQLETAVHGEILSTLSRPRERSSHEARFQVVTCIDVRSEPLRRALELNSHAETFGFAGFFGLFARVEATGYREGYDSFPVIGEARSTITGGSAPSGVAESRDAAGATLAELTHEPSAMFALAEGLGWMVSPWLVARSLFPRLTTSRETLRGSWVLDDPLALDVAESALRTMGLTQNFAREVLFLGHASSSSNNTHFSTLDCGACAGHGGGPNAAALASLLNDLDVRARLATRGIHVPVETTFLAGEHDTTREIVSVFSPCSNELLELLNAASATVATWRAGGDADHVARARRRLERRARDWAETRPEWALADHSAFVVGPRASFRGVDLGGRSFLHSYDPAGDTNGEILTSIFSAPVVVAQWINAAYYFASVTPDLFGAGDKTLLNPVGDFAVISGDDPDLRVGLPLQSVVDGDRPVHLPVRLLVVVEAPFERIERALQHAAVFRQLVDGEWVRLVARENEHSSWRSWSSEHGWVS